MKRISIILFSLLVFIPNFVFAQATNLPNNINLVYSPIGGYFDTESSIDNKIRKDIQDIAKFSNLIRIYDVGHTLSVILQEAQNNSLKVAVGIDLTSNDSENYSKIKKTLEQIKPFQQTVHSIILDKNGILNNEINSKQLINYLRFVHENSNFKVTSLNYNQTWVIHSEFVSEVDYILFDDYTMYKTSEPREAVNQIQKDYDFLVKLFPNKQIVVESGWSTENSSNQLQKQFISALDKTSMSFFLFEYQNESNKEFGIKESLFPVIIKQKVLSSDPSNQEKTNFLIENLPIGNYDLMQKTTGKHAFLQYGTDYKIIIDNEGIKSDIIISESNSMNMFGFIFANADKIIKYDTFAGNPGTCDSSTKCVLVKFNKDEPFITLQAFIGIIIGTVITVIVTFYLNIFLKRVNTKSLGLFNLK